MPPKKQPCTCTCTSQELFTNIADRRLEDASYVDITPDQMEPDADTRPLALSDLANSRADRISINSLIHRTNTDS